MLLSPDAARSLDRASAGGDLSIRARRLVEGLYQGRHRTPHRGASTEFYDFRPYTPGDPLTRIDWKLFGRTDRHYVRRFHQDAQLSVTIVLDASASMDFASAEDASRRRDESGVRVTKFRRAQELAAALAFLAVRQGDRVGLVIAGGAPLEAGGPESDEPRVVVPGAGWGALHRCVEALERTGVSAWARGGGSSGGRATLAPGFDACSLLLRDRGIVIGIGDALEDLPGLLSSVARLKSAGRSGAAARRTMRDVSLIHVLSRDELELPQLSSAARFVDPETHASVRTSPRVVADRYAGLIHEHCEALRLGIQSLGGRYALATPADDPVETLRRFLAG